MGIDLPLTGHADPQGIQGHAEAQFQLGTMFFHGEGVPANNVAYKVFTRFSAGWASYLPDCR